MDSLRSTTVQFEQLDRGRYTIGERSEAILYNALRFPEGATSAAEPFFKEYVDKDKHLNIRIIEFLGGSDGFGHKVLPGTLLYETDPYAQYYIASASIGYEGSGPQLTRRLLAAFDIGEDDFNELNERARSTFPNYGIRLVLTR